MLGITSEPGDYPETGDKLDPVDYPESGEYFRVRRLS
jgi:hypothetical protein